MATKPTTTIPNWASDATYTAGIETGLAPTLLPAAAEISQGVRPGKWVARKANWLFRTCTQWLKYLETKTDGCLDVVAGGTWTAAGSCTVNGTAGVQTTYDGTTLAHSGDVEVTGVSRLKGDTQFGDPASPGAEMNCFGPAYLRGDVQLGHSVNPTATTVLGSFESRSIEDDGTSVTITTDDLSVPGTSVFGTGTGSRTTIGNDLVTQRHACSYNVLTNVTTNNISSLFEYVIVATISGATGTLNFTFSDIVPGTRFVVVNLDGKQLDITINGSFFTTIGTPSSHRSVEFMFTTEYSGWWPIRFTEA